MDHQQYQIGRTKVFIKVWIIDVLFELFMVFKPNDNPTLVLRIRIKGEGGGKNGEQRNGSNDNNNIYFIYISLFLCNTEMKLALDWTCLFRKILFYCAKTVMIMQNVE